MGIVLRCDAVGTAPTADPRLLAALRRASEAGAIIVAVSQRLPGSVVLRRYPAGSTLADLSVFGGFDTTTEAGFTKLHALLAFARRGSRVSDAMQRNLGGELTASWARGPPPRSGSRASPEPVIRLKRPPAGAIVSARTSDRTSRCPRATSASSPSTATGR